MRSQWSGAACIVVACTALAVPAAASAVSPRARAPHRARDAAKPYFDSRRGSRAIAPAGPGERAARGALIRRLGHGAAVDVDRVTGTVRSLQKLDGTLSAPASGDRGAVAMRWVRANRAALGLTDADIDALRLDYRVVTARAGVTHLRYRQAYRGIPAFDNDLRVNLDRGGRILNVTGSPVSGLHVASIAPQLDAAAALRALQKNVGVERAVKQTAAASGARRETRFGDDIARLVLFTGAGGTRLAWHVTYHASSAALYDAVVDAASGVVLYRQNLVKYDSDATVWPNYPGGELQRAPLDETNAPQTIDLETAGTVGPPWITAADDELDGAYVHTYSDVDDDNAPGAGESIPRRTPEGDFNYPFTQFGEPPGYTSACDFSDPDPDGWPDPLSPGVLCAWDPTAPTSWQTNREQDGVQAFYLASRFHDHLANSNIGFTDDTDGFGGTRTGDQDDPVLTEADDGAGAGPGGGPDGDHVNNANMATEPDGSSPRMQLYLGQYDPDAFFTFRDMNFGDDAATVWHEYTHGLSNRLVVNDDGTGALSTPHGGAMGEAWSDWYAMDLLVRDGLALDDPDRAGEVDIGISGDARFTSTRFEPIDCPVNTTAPHCPGGIATGHGGYTLGDFGKVAGAPEVHSDGEIWMQTLWDLRSTLVQATGSDTDGSDLGEALVTEGMRLSPPEPSFLDMRNSILAAETALLGGEARDLVWQVFADRGMGFYAGVDDASDVTPVEDFNTPPADDAPQGTANGTVTSADTGLPLGGVTVGPGGHTTDPAFQDDIATTTADDGRYTLQLPEGRYGSLNFIGGAGFDLVALPDFVVRGGQTNTNDVALRRDWAASKGGAVVVKDDTKYDNTGASFGCGLNQLIDQSQGAGSSAFNPDSTDPDNPHLGPPTALIVLPQAITVSAFGLDPSNTCGDDESAATKDFRVETSSDGVNFKPALEGSFTLDDLHTLNVIAPTANGTNVKYVRLTALTPQSTEPGDSGVDFIDFSEIEVFGGPPNALPTGSLSATPGTVQAGQPVSFDASSFTDPDSKITGYDWDFDGDGTVDRTTAGPTTEFAYPAAGAFTAKVAAQDFRGGAGQASAPVTVTPVPPGPSGGQPSIRLPKSGSRGRIRFTVSCALACTVSGKLTLTPRSARELRLKRWTLRRLTRHLSAAGSRQFTLRLPSRVKRAAARRGRKFVKVVLSINATQADRQDKTGRRKIRVKL